MQKQNNLNTVYEPKIHIEGADDVMIDIETLGDVDYSVITSIGAVVFNINTGQILSTFHEYMDISESLASGFRITGDTLKWWIDKPLTLKNEILNGTDYPVVVLDKFNKFLKTECNDNFYIWGRGPSFDLIRLKQYYSLYSMKTPWNFRNEQCVRTLERLRPEIKKALDDKRNDELHSSINDAIHQAKYTSLIFQDVTGSRKAT
jgi:hypothetical protein